MDNEKKEITLKVARQIKHFRTLQELSQESLALSAGINTAYFGHIERGLKCPTVDTLNKIACALGISLAQLLTFDVDEPDKNKEALEKIFLSIHPLPPEQALKVAAIVQDIVTLCAEK